MSRRRTKWLHSPVSDVVVVGGGHNALVCAAYLAEAGLSVTVLEGRDVIGGNTVTEELTLPGWHHDSCSTAHVVLQSNPLIRDDELGLIARYGLKYIVTDPAVVLPTARRRPAHRPPDLGRRADEFARYSTRRRRCARVDDRRLERRPADRACVLSRRDFRCPTMPWSRSYDELRRRSAWDVIASTFEHPVTRRVMTWMAFATIQPPSVPAPAHCPPRSWPVDSRSAGPLPSAGPAPSQRRWSPTSIDHGGTVETSAWVDAFLVEDGRCTGVRTKDGREFRAGRAVVAGSHLRELPGMLDVDSAMADEAARRWRPGLPVFAVHLALRSDVRYRTPRGPITAVAGGLGTPDGLRRQVAGADDGTLETDEPWLLLVSSTVVDPDRAPGGVFKLLTVAPMLLDGRPWTDADAAAHAEALLDYARMHVDGLEPDDILAMRPESPTTIAAHNLSNVGGSCHGGEFVLDDGEVIPGWRDYRTDVDGLYLTGSTSHPGGSVSGRPGRNTARVVLGDLGIDPATVMPAP